MKREKTSVKKRDSPPQKKLVTFFQPKKILVQRKKTPRDFPNVWSCFFGEVAFWLLSGKSTKSQKQSFGFKIQAFSLEDHPG